MGLEVQRGIADPELVVGVSGPSPPRGRRDLGLGPGTVRVGDEALKA